MFAEFLYFIFYVFPFIYIEKKNKVMRMCHECVRLFLPNANKSITVMFLFLICRTVYLIVFSVKALLLGLLNFHPFFWYRDV